MIAMTVTPPPVLLPAVDPATYAGVEPATLRVWKHRYGLTAWQGRDGSNLYDMAKLAEIMAKRETGGRTETTTPPNHLDVLDAA
jgi:hypothetical protein